MIDIKNSDFYKKRIEMNFLQKKTLNFFFNN